jgi:hypothetical protein
MPGPRPKAAKVGMTMGNDGEMNRYGSIATV